MGTPNIRERLQKLFYLPSDAILKMKDNNAFATGAWSSIPTAGSDQRGVMFRTEGATGVADALQICLKNTADAYVNYQVATTYGYGAYRNVLASSGNTTMTSAMSGSVMLVDGASVAYALPAIGAADVGMTFHFVVTVASTAATITAGAADLLTGGVAIASTTAGGTDAFSPDVSDDLVITMNGTTKGGVIGSWVSLTAISATRWWVQGVLIGSGTLVTPFS